MRILLLCHTFNSLSQRLFIELRRAGHAVSVEFDIHDAVTAEAVVQWRPDLIIAPFLKRAIPESVWKKQVCLVVHPGIRGDRGPSALDWAILEGEGEWGVTVLQANAEMDGGDIWAEARFPMRTARKSSLYRNEVTEAATRAVLEAVEKFAGGNFVPQPLDVADPQVRGRLRPPMRQHDRAIHWARDDTAAVLRKIHAADGVPGVLDEMLGVPLYLYDARPESALRGEPGAVIARRGGALCRATADGALWIGHVRIQSVTEATFKLPATLALQGKLDGIPELEGEDSEDIRYTEKNGVGYLAFEFYNGAMGSAHCERLRAAWQKARERDTRVLVLLGGTDFWSNGIHLNLIEAADSPADESWRNINAMNDLARAIIETGSHLTLAALRGNAGAGGVFLALTADRVVVRDGVVLNPHYKAMGNLYGSEYWTYLLPRRVGAARAREITENRLPISARQARELGLIDACLDATPEAFLRETEALAEALAQAPDFAAQLAAKQARRARDEAEKPLAAYRAEELERMTLNFYGFDPSYHVARHHFVHRVPHSHTPRHLALHGEPEGRG
jgi:putative two-component system hydrogenase maturation factor HypX/HoxX